MEAFSIIAALATAIQAVALITLHPLPTGYNPVRDAVSDYGVGPYRWWFWLQGVAGVGCLALGIALAQLHPFTLTEVAVAPIVTAVARLLIPFFATDQECPDLLMPGRVVEQEQDTFPGQVMTPQPTPRL